MYNRTQQRFDKSIREAVEATKRANDAKPRRDVRTTMLPDESRAEGKMMLMLDRETQATVLVPWGHPDAVARRAERGEPDPDYVLVAKRRHLSATVNK